ncbi:major capsid protein [Erwinia phage Zoomie]|uniref:Major capsid protein n=1 Tax=Erwinia phage Zoomie TaxID=2851072 RepID=A0A9E6N8S0_9CAUD|nr:major capsid protein [Erwinia phage Zoomie]
MADTIYAGALTRPHWGGADSDVDIHLEVYQNEVDTAFQYNAIFTGLSAQRSTADRSNTYRIDRLANSVVKGRKSGQALEAQSVKNDKMLIVVDTTLYIRNPIDYQDDWTAPDFLREMGMNNGTSFAETFDEAHAIQLVKARSWEAPEHLKPAFKDGVEIDVTLKADAQTQDDLEANAILINKAHRDGIDVLVKRKVPLNDMVTLIGTDEYSVLLEHPKLFNNLYGQTNDDGYKGRRVVTMNGIPVVEFLEFPEGVITDHPLGSAFNVTAEDAKCKMVIFSKSKTLVTVEAKAFTSDFWNDRGQFSNVLDCYAMYTVGVRRPDTAVVVKFTYA